MYKVSILSAQLENQALLIVNTIIQSVVVLRVYITKINGAMTTVHANRTTIHNTFDCFIPITLYELSIRMHTYLGAVDNLPAIPTHINIGKLFVSSVSIIWFQKS